jgi:hypothetical protein
MWSVISGKPWNHPYLPLCLVRQARRRAKKKAFSLKKYFFSQLKESP